MKRHILFFLILSLAACVLYGSPALSQSQPLPDSSIIRELEEAPPPEVVEDQPIAAPAEEEGVTVVASDPRFTPRWDWYTGDSAAPLRTLSADARRRIMDDDDFWYANRAFTKEKKKISTYVPLSERSWFQTLLWIVIIGGFGAFLVIYLSGNNVSLFRRRAARLATDTGGEEIPQDIFAIRYQQEIDKAIRSRNYRLAVRLLFLRLLRNMADKNVIRYQHDKTNLEYLLQLRPTHYYHDFFRITRHYEYSWYGQFEVSEEAFRVIHDEINRFDNQIGNP